MTGKSWRYATDSEVQGRTGTMYSTQDSLPLPEGFAGTISACFGHNTSGTPSSQTRLLIRCMRGSVCPVDPRRLSLIFLSFHLPESFKTLDKMEREDEFLHFTPNYLPWDFHWAQTAQRQNEPVTGGLNSLASESWQSMKRASLYSEIRSSWCALWVGPMHSVRRVLQLENPFIVSHGCHCTESAIPNIVLFSQPFSGAIHWAPDRYEWTRWRQQTQHN